MRITTVWITFLQIVSYQYLALGTNFVLKCAAGYKF